MPRGGFVYQTVEFLGVVMACVARPESFGLMSRRSVREYVDVPSHHPARLPQSCSPRRPPPRKAYAPQVYSQQVYSQQVEPQPGAGALCGGAAPRDGRRLHRVPVQRHRRGAAPAAAVVPGAAIHRSVSGAPPARWSRSSRRAAPRSAIRRHAGRARAPRDGPALPAAGRLLRRQARARHDRDRYAEQVPLSGARKTAGRSATASASAAPASPGPA